MGAHCRGVLWLGTWPALSRGFYEEGVMVITKYLEEKEGRSILTKIYELLTQYRARVTHTRQKTHFSSQRNSRPHRDSR